MPHGLKRYQQTRQLHFVTFSCYRRLPYLTNDHAKNTVEQILEHTRRTHNFDLHGYVLMPEHVHLLLSEPERHDLATTLRVLKQETAKLLIGDGEHFWQIRYYDFNVRSEKKRIEKLRYIHHNPVKRGLVLRPEDYRWSSAAHYATGARLAVEIASYWTARRTLQDRPDQPPRPPQPSISHAEGRVSHA